MGTQHSNSLTLFRRRIQQKGSCVPRRSRIPPCWSDVTVTGVLICWSSKTLFELFLFEGLSVEQNQQISRTIPTVCVSESTKTIADIRDHSYVFIWLRSYEITVFFFLGKKWQKCSNSHSASCSDHWFFFNKKDNLILSMFKQFLCVL